MWIHTGGSEGRGCRHGTQSQGEWDHWVQLGKQLVTGPEIHSPLSFPSTPLTSEPFSLSWCPNFQDSFLNKIVHHTSESRWSLGIDQVDGGQHIQDQEMQENILNIPRNIGYGRGKGNKIPQKGFNCFHGKKLFLGFQILKLILTQVLKSIFYLQLLQNIGFIPCITQCTPEPTLVPNSLHPPQNYSCPSLCPLAITNFFPCIYDSASFCYSH